MFKPLNIHLTIDLFMTWLSSFSPCFPLNVQKTKGNVICWFPVSHPKMRKDREIATHTPHSGIAWLVSPSIAIVVPLLQQKEKVPPYVKVNAKEILPLRCLFEVWHVEFNFVVSISEY